MNKQFDLIVVGGGVLGTFCALHALEKGWKVALLEKDKRPQGATVRNFGMVVPSGMDLKWQKYGRESLEIYAKLQEKIDLTARKTGSLYVASDAEELALIEEIAQINESAGYSSRMLSKETCLEKMPGLRKDYAKGGLYFSEDMLVEPHAMIHRLQEFLRAEKNLQLFNYEQVNQCERVGDKVEVTTSFKTKLWASHVMICNGSEFQALYPELFLASDLKAVKLQMLQTKPQPNSFRLPCGILSGHSIRRYEAFSECPSFAKIKEKEPVESAIKKWGINLLLKQGLDGSVIIGDSHEYAAVAVQEDLGFGIKEEINALMLEEARKIIDLPTFEIEKQWIGTYSQCQDGLFERTIDGRIHILTGIGGKGMTASPAYAREKIDGLSL